MKIIFGICKYLVEKLGRGNLIRQTFGQNMRPLARSCGDVIMGRCYQYLTSSEVRALPKIWKSCNRKSNRKSDIVNRKSNRKSEIDNRKSEIP